MKTGIIGGGMMGLATAWYLAKAGMDVTIFEKNDNIGGLSCAEEIMPDLIWDRFYHVILTGDRELLDFLDDIGLSSDVLFRETRTGFYTDSALHSMSSSMEFLKFRPLSLWNKFRLGAGIVYSSKISNSGHLQTTSAREWLVRVFGQKNYEKLWEPLLRSKLGSAKDRASASFIWACIARYYGTRHSGEKKEMMGCVRGGYNNILTHLKTGLLKNGVKIVENRGIENISSPADKRICLHDGNGDSFTFDKVVATVSSPQVTDVWPDMPDDFKNSLEEVEYLGIVCATLVLKKSLSPFYIINLTDPGFPFTGVIEATHVIPEGTFGDKALVYLPRYAVHDDPILEKSDNEITDEFLEALKRIFPDFSKNDILSIHINRETFVQPIQEVGYFQKIPKVKTPLENFYMVNTSMIEDSTLNNNEVIRLASKMAKILTC